MGIITLDDLARAIASRVGIDMDVARRDANFVMDLFGFEDRIIDNVLEPRDRQLFYILEEEGMLTTEREETTIYDGRTWRTHYWLINKETILKYKKPKNETEEVEEDDMGNIYKELPDEIWLQREL